MGTQLAYNRLRGWIVLRWIPEWVRLSPLYDESFRANCHPSVIGQVSTILKTIYGKQYTGNSAQKNVTAIAFAGTVVGQLFFGYTSDHYSRKWSLMASTLILFVFAALGAGSYGGGSVNGMLQALTAYRFLIGIGIG